MLIFSSYSLNLFILNNKKILSFHEFTQANIFTDEFFFFVFVFLTLLTNM